MNLTWGGLCWRSKSESKEGYYGVGGAFFEDEAFGVVEGQLVSEAEHVSYFLYYEQESLSYKRTAQKTKIVYFMPHPTYPPKR